MNFLPIASLLLTCAIASDHGRRPSKKSSKKAADKVDYSSLETVEDVQKEAADIVKGIIKSIKEIPEKTLRGEKLFNSDRSCLKQMWICKDWAKTVRHSLSPESRSFRKMEQIIVEYDKFQKKLGTVNTEWECCNSRTKKTSRNKKKSTTAPEKRDYTKYIDFRVQAINEIMSAINNFAEFPFKELYKLSRFLIEFATDLGSAKSSEIDLLEGKFWALRERNTILRVQSSTIDWKNIETLYASYSRELQAILSENLQAPKGTNIHKMSVAFWTLVKATGDFAALTANKESIEKRIKIVTEKERDTFELVNAREEMMDHEESTSSDGTRSSTSSDEDSES